MVKRKRADKGRAVARYIATEGGITTAKFEGIGNWIEMPHPYNAKVVTDRSLARIMEYLPEVKDIGFVIRYDGNMKTVRDATVTMRIDAFAALLKTHYETTKREGE
jgi:hypothetical protein